jgi:hypothetical protein
MHLRAFAVLSLAVAAGCGPHHYLMWEAAPPAPTMMGRVAVTVTDRREAKRGGEDPTSVGFQRSGWGIPYPIRIGDPSQLAMDVHDLLSQAMLSSGVGVLAPGQPQGATSHVMVDIQNFWCDGYWPVYKAGVALGVTVVDPATNTVRMPGQPLLAEGQAGDCRNAYHNALNTLFNNARAMFSAPQVHDALAMPGPGGAPPPPPPGAPPPPPGQ